MDCLEAILTRRSIRAFLPDEISQEDLLQILEAGRLAPNAGNLQPFYFVVVKDPAIRAKLKEAALGQELVGQAPVIIAVCADPDRSEYYGKVGRDRLSLLDCANATENMLLAAHALGYGACWVGGFNGSEVKAILGLPDHFHMVSLIPVGKPAAPPITIERRTLEEVVRWDKW